MHTCTTCGAACNALSPTMDCPVCYADALGHGRAMNATDELLRSLSEKERRAVVAYGAQVCLRCDTVVNVLGESPMSAVRSYQLGAKLNWRQVAACAAAGASISEALDEAREEFEALLRAGDFL